MPKRPLVCFAFLFSGGMALICFLVGAITLFATEPPAFDYGSDPMRYIENDRIKLGIDLSLGGAVTFLTDQENGGQNMINSADWGRQIQLSYYSGPSPFIGPNGEEPSKHWAALGWNPIQTGDYGGIKSKTIKFEYRDDNTMYVRCIPMQWPHTNVPGDCEFEAVYTIRDNVVHLEATIHNNRFDKAQYHACGQEMPALYTNGPWYKLVTYLGDQPFENKPVTTVVDKNDGKGWPWVNFTTPERWVALLDEQGWGVGVYQPQAVRFTNGFAGGDTNKGHGGEKGGQTGYIAPTAMQILDHNIDWKYETFFVLGRLENIRDFVKSKEEPKLEEPPMWNFQDSRDMWYYAQGVKDTGWPIKEGLQITFPSRGLLVGPDTFWKASQAPILEIEASFTPFKTATGSSESVENSTLGIQLLPYGLADNIDWLAWSEGEQSVEKERQAKANYPQAEPFAIPTPVQLDGVVRTYRINLSKHPKYQGAMKRLNVILPDVSGSAVIKSIRFVKSDKPAVVAQSLSDGTVRIDQGGSFFALYHPNYRGTPIIWPICSSAGSLMTRSYPMIEDAAIDTADSPELTNIIQNAKRLLETEAKDHPHHRSIWFTHGNVLGRDFWALDRDADILQKTMETVKNADGTVSIITENNWVDTNESKILCVDQRVWTFGAFQLDEKEIRYLDFDVVVTATDESVRFGDTKEGSFGIRVPGSVDVLASKRSSRFGQLGGTIINSAGQTNDDAWGQQASWVDYFGPVALPITENQTDIVFETAGITMMNHPNSFRYPTWWHVRTYGLFTANPFGQKDFEPLNESADGTVRLQPNESFHLSYRVVFHDDSLPAVFIEKLFEDYSALPK